MQRINRNIITLGRLFVLAFFVANTGFTLFLRYCTMATPECCGMDDNCPTSSCETGHAAATPKTATTTLGSVCVAVSVAGGYHTDPSVIGKDLTPRQVKSEILPAVTIDIASLRVNTQPLSALSSAGRSPFPPPVETYVLNATLLI